MLKEYLSHVSDSNNRDTLFSAEILKQGYRYHNFRKTFSKYYRQHSKYNSEYYFGLKKHYLKQRQSEIIDLWWLSLQTKESWSKTSRKHAYIILTPLNPTFI